MLLWKWRVSGRDDVLVGERSWVGLSVARWTFHSVTWKKGWLMIAKSLGLQLDMQQAYDADDGSIVQSKTFSILWYTPTPPPLPCCLYLLRW